MFIPIKRIIRPSDYIPLRLTDHGGSSCHSRPGALVKVVGCRHASVRHLKASVDVDTARHHHAAMSIDGLHPAWDDQVLPNLPKEQEWRGVEKRE